MQAEGEEPILDQLILETIKKKNPKNVEELVEIVYKRSSKVSKSTVLKHIEKLEERKKLTLIKEPTPKKGLWFWIIIALTVTTNILVFQVWLAELEQSILLPIRGIIGYAFCFLVPGYCTVKVLFPKKGLDVVETMLISVALSLAIIPLVGLVVNFVIGSIALLPIMISLSLVVVILASIAYLKHG